MSELPGDVVSNAGANIVAGVSVAGLAALLARKLWRAASSEGVETRHDRAESALYSNIKAEMDSMQANMVAVRERVDVLERRHRKSQTIAVEAYALASIAVEGGKTSDVEGVKALLKQIIEG